MTRAKAIAKHCLECSGGSPKDVTLCHLFDCSLWEYRTGDHIRTKQYKRRIERAKIRYVEDLKEIAKLDSRARKFFNL